MNNQTKELTISAIIIAVVVLVTFIIVTIFIGRGSQCITDHEKDDTGYVIAGITICLLGLIGSLILIGLSSGLYVKILEKR